MECEIRFSDGHARVINVKTVHTVGADLVVMAPGGVLDGVLDRRTHGGFVLLFKEMVG